MITRIEATNYRSLRQLQQPLGPFNVLVGPNGSGKSTFMDVIAFVGRLFADGVEAAVAERTPNFGDLFWGRAGDSLALSVEAALRRSGTDRQSAIRYEVVLGSDKEQRFGKRTEQIRLHKQQGGTLTFPGGNIHEDWYETLDDRQYNDVQFVRVENQDRDLHPWQIIPSDPDTSAVRWLSYDKSLFPTTAAFANLLIDGVLRLDLKPDRLRAPSPPGKGSDLGPDGVNFPFVVANLIERAPERFGAWLSHLQTALPDLVGIRVIDRPEDRHRYLMIQYAGGLEVPSWMVSDGTLRLMALTILAYVPDPPAICMIEEPENSLHPTNIETVMQSLSSVYGGQVLVSTHSPIVLAATKPENVLVFARDSERGTTITRGDEHPALRDWGGEVDLGSLFAGGVLG